MAIKTDYHMHTRHSGDNDTPMSQMIEGAIAKGLTQICITEHNDFDYAYVIPKEEEEGLFLLDVAAYYKEYKELSAKYSDRIRVLFGTEIGIQPHITKELTAYVSRYDFDFIIGSTHIVHKMDPYYPYYFDGRSDTEAFMEYFEATLENIKAFSDYDVYGHLDYVIRYSPNKDKNFSYRNYADIIDEILRELLNRGVGLEINTGGLRKNLRSTNPCIEILKKYRELGGEIITVASDAHNPADIASRFDDAEAILKEAGFKYYTIFEKRKPQFIKL